MNDKLIKVNLSKIDNFKEHPFLVNNDSSLMELVKSIKENGLLNPMVVREKENGRYELISGHRRKKALEILGIQEIEVVLKELNDDEATIFMVDSNIYRERVLPSEKAFAYKMKMEILKNNPNISNINEFNNNSPMGTEDGKTQIYRYIRLTELIKILQEKVNNEIIPLRAGVELSFLSKQEQQIVYSVITYEDATPSHSQAIRIRKLSKKKLLTFDDLDKILLEEKGNQHEKISFNKSKIISVLPFDLVKRDKRYIEQYIIEAIKSYKTTNK